MLRVLTLTTLYPNSANSRHGIFVETRIQQLRRVGDVSIDVVAPVPWFPSSHPAFGRYAAFARVPSRETRAGVQVLHPRYPVVPKIGMRLQPAFLASAFERGVRALLKCGKEFDVVDSHYLFPDAVAAAQVARRLGLPHVTTARGSDVNVIAQIPWARDRIVRAADAASRVIAVSSSLSNRLAFAGVDPLRIEILRNGVDCELFKPLERKVARRKLGWADVPTVLSVGNLVAGKGHDLVMRAVAGMHDVHIVVVGEGPERGALLRLADELGISMRMRLLNSVTQDHLAVIYSAADVLALGSQREGWPNVLLESMACGTPVATTDVGAARDIVLREEAGTVVSSPGDDTFGMALSEVLRRKTPPNVVREVAKQFEWGPIALEYRAALMRAAHAADLVEDPA